MGERADIYEMGLTCWQLGLTPDTIQDVISLGASCNTKGISKEDIIDLWRIKVRSYPGGF